MLLRVQLIPAQSLVCGSRAARRGQKPQNSPGAVRSSWKDVAATPQSPDPRAFRLAPNLNSHSPCQVPPRVPASGLCLRRLGQLTRSPAPSRPRPAPVPVTRGSASSAARRADSPWGR